MKILTPNDSFEGIDFKAGAIFLIDKPANWTSFDVVNKIRFRFKKAYGIKKFKVGHAGTLDPLATGLLILCVGKATKQINDYMGMSKTYTGSITIGSTTPSYDLETEIDKTFPTDHINTQMLIDATQELSGDINQIPPMFSAIKKEGRRLYKDARKGITVELEPRPVTIHGFTLEEKSFPILNFEVICSKGTYIRSLAYDFGKLLKSGSHLSSLRRTEIGKWDFSTQSYTSSYHVKDAYSVEELTKKLELHFDLDIAY